MRQLIRRESNERSPKGSIVRNPMQISDRKLTDNLHNVKINVWRAEEWGSVIPRQVENRPRKHLIAEMCFEFSAGEWKFHLDSFATATHVRKYVQYKYDRWKNYRAISLSAKI